MLPSLNPASVWDPLLHRTYADCFEKDGSERLTENELSDFSKL
jgi:hypothetical protein